MLLGGEAYNPIAGGKTPMNELVTKKKKRLLTAAGCMPQIHRENPEYKFLMFRVQLNPAGSGC